MTEEIKAILDKKEADRTEEENAKVKEAASAFQAEIAEVCKKHGLCHKAVITYTAEGITPVFQIIRVAEEKAEPAA